MSQANKNEKETADCKKREVMKLWLLILILSGSAVFLSLFVHLLLLFLMHIVVNQTINIYYLKKKIILTKKKLTVRFSFMWKKSQSHIKVMKMYISCENILSSHVKVLIQLPIFW